MKRESSMGREKYFLGLFIFILIVGLTGCAGILPQTKSKPIEKDSSEKIVPAKPRTVETTSPPQPPVSPASPPASVPGPTAPVPTQAPAPPPQPSPVRLTPSVKPPESRSGPGVVFNFDNADIYEVIRVMAEVMKINYIIDPRVRGVVNIRTASPISTEEVLSVFQSILRLNGATAVKKDHLYEIVPFGEAKKLPVFPADRIEPGKPIPDGRYILQIIPLKYIPVTEVSKMLKPFLSDGSDIVEHPPHNILIIGDVASNVRKALDIITLFDLDIFTSLRVRIYPILNADVTEIAKEMERIFSSFEVSTKSGRGVGITFTPITRINSLLTVSSMPHIFEKVEGWLRELDRAPAEATKLGVFVYFVQNMRAKDLADVLKQIFMGVKEKKEEFKQKVSDPAPRGVKPLTPATPATPPLPSEASVAPEGEINIAVDETNNALIVRAFARDYKGILETIKKLDIYPKQVLIETFLADITLDDSVKYGIEWARFLSSNPPNAQEVVVQGRPPTDPFALAASAITQSGIRYSIVELGGRVSAAISAAATDNRLNVISSPHVLASNNKEAKIQIGTSEPILTNTFTTTSTSTIGVVEGTIEYKDVGIILTVTPRINDGGLITLEIQVEKSTADVKDVFDRTNVPFFNKTTAKTVLSVLEGQTIVIGGLMDDQIKRNKGGIPLLSRIPLIGALFGTHDYGDKKRELILLMTPHIITDHLQSRTVTEEFKEKLEKIKKELETWEEKRKK